MEKIIIDPTANTPKVILDPEQNVFEISGESRPFDVPQFYSPLLEWLDEFGQHLKEQNDPDAFCEFKFLFEYFNSLSAKYILDLCKKLSRLRSEGNNILVKWHYEEGDDYMQETGHEMSRIAKLPFEFVEISIQ